MWRRSGLTRRLTWSSSEELGPCPSRGWTVSWGQGCGSSRGSSLAALPQHPGGFCPGSGRCPLRGAAGKAVGGAARVPNVPVVPALGVAALCPAGPGGSGDRLAVTGLSQACRATPGTAGPSPRCASIGCEGSARGATAATSCTTTTPPGCPSAISTPSSVGAGLGIPRSLFPPLPEPLASLGPGLEQVADATS